MGLAAGIVDGAQLGDNAKAALLTRGIVEITRLGTVMGAKPETFTGLAGFGDLFTTCVSPYGRNRTTGERLGRGETLEDILESTNSVTEGVPTTRAVVALARKYGIEMPITQALHAVLFDPNRFRKPSARSGQRPSCHGGGRTRLSSRPA